MQSTRWLSCQNVHIIGQLPQLKFTPTYSSIDITNCRQFQIRAVKYTQSTIPWLKHTHSGNDRAFRAVHT